MYFLVVGFFVGIVVVDVVIVVLVFDVGEMWSGVVGFCEGVDVVDEGGMVDVEVYCFGFVVIGVSDGVLYEFVCVGVGYGV